MDNLRNFEPTCLGEFSSLLCSYLLKDLMTLSDLAFRVNEDLSKLIQDKVNRRCACLLDNVFCFGAVPCDSHQKQDDRNHEENALPTVRLTVSAVLFMTFLISFSRKALTTIGKEASNKFS